MRRTTLTLALAALVLTAVACNNHDVDTFEDKVTAERADIVAAFGNNKVDILWVVDNSGSMCEEQQSLGQNFDAFITSLVDDHIDFNLAVITTDMQDPAQRGRFQNRPDADAGPACSVSVDVSDCPDATPLVISAADPRYHAEDGSLAIDLLQRDFGCNATVGTRGNGFEMGLDAARAAFDPELLANANQGFLRDDALLAIVFLTDENDCSGADPTNLTNGNICEWDRDSLTPETTYIDFFAGLKEDPSQVIVAGIIAPDDGLRYDYGDEVNPSCSSSSGQGYSGYRYANVVNGFEHGGLANICAPDQFHNALADIATDILLATDRRCLTAAPQTCASDADCPDHTCATRGGDTTFCASFTLQVELLRLTTAGPLDGADCQPASEHHILCVLTEGDHYTVNYNDPTCSSSGMSIDLLYTVLPHETLTVRYPRQVTPL